MFLKYVNAMKYLETIPDFLSMYGVFTSQSTSQIRQEMSSRVTIMFIVVISTAGNHVTANVSIYTKM